MKDLWGKCKNFLLKDRETPVFQSAKEPTETDPLFKSVADSLTAQQEPETPFDLRRRLFREAKDGEVSAMVLYGHMLMRAEGGARDEIEARNWFQRAASHQNAEAMFMYGKLLIYAKGGSRDMKKGFSWVRKAAQMGFYEARVFLTEWEQKYGGNSHE